MTSNTSPDPLGSTARWTASVRAKESERADGLFHDPWAAALAGEEGLAWIEQRTVEKTLPMVLRTRFFDDFLIQVTNQHAVRQVILVAAGLDTRAYRLEWPAQTQLFELDQPAVLTYKEQVLSAVDGRPTCTRHPIAADLIAPWQETLLAAGFDAKRPSAWLLEGFLFYLSNENITNLLDTVTGLAAPGSWLGFDIVNGAVFTHPLTRQWVEMQAQAGAPWIGSIDDPQTFLAQRGWKATLSQPGAADANYGRWSLPNIPVDRLDLPHNWFVTAQK